MHWIRWKFSAHPGSVQNWVCGDPEERAWVVCCQKPERMLPRLRIACWLGCAWERTKWYVCTDEELCGQVQQFVRNLWVYFAVYGQYLTKVWRLRRRGSQEKFNTNQRWVQDSTWTCKKRKGKLFSTRMLPIGTMTLINSAMRLKIWRKKCVTSLTPLSWLRNQSESVCT